MKNNDYSDGNMIMFFGCGFWLFAFLFWFGVISDNDDLTNICIIPTLSSFALYLFFYVKKSNKNLEDKRKEEKELSNLKMED